MEILTKNTEETKEFGRKFGAELKVNRKKAVVLALTGELGSGKTTFVQGLAEGLGIKQRIISPTFILVRKYKIPFSHQPLAISYLYHIDLYRLEKNIEGEVNNLGIEDFWKSPENVIVIEWAEKIKSMIPKSTIWIKFENLGEDKRRISLMTND